MNVSSIQSAVPTRQVEPVEFLVRDGDEAHPSQLVFALAGVCEALDELTDATDGDRAHSNMVGNLAVAAHVLARQLAARID